MNGWIILDKESGLFSRTAGGRIARMFGEKTFGHIGTLDPMASGVLPIAIGSATKMIPYVEELAGAEKEYEFTIKFGVNTDTLDITRREIARNDIIPSREQVLSVLPKFVGEISQIPPVYSAVHVAGRRAYELARRGNVPEMQPRTVHIYSLDLTDFNGDIATLRVRCSRGTYVRALARDIAAACGTIGVAAMIRRTESSGINIKNAVKLDFLENLFNNGADFKQYLEPIDFGLGDIPVLKLNDKSSDLYRHGGFIATDANDGLHRVYNDEEFIGIGVVADGMLHPKRTI